MSRRDVVEAILCNEIFGAITIEADYSHLRELLAQIKETGKKRSLSILTTLNSAITGALNSLLYNAKINV
ncbi:MAG TPA: hypothetical protein DIU00_16270 [Phycisphaerales bacterium]|nr:hypothetical protein [Phycisphaerales bacterium]